MLGLKLATDPRWVNIVEKSIEDILTDHAYCEQKAATSAITLIQMFPEKNQLVRSLAPMVTEEWEHFRLVLSEIDKRNLTLGKQRKDEYVNELVQFQKKGGNRDDLLLERLLTFAMIEARSCERFRLLSLYISDDSLKSFYHKFMIAEAGHYSMFIDLAKTYIDEEIVKKRWEEYLLKEAEIMNALEFRPDRVH